MNNRNNNYRRQNIHHNHRRRKKKSYIPRGYVYITTFIIVAFLVAGGFFVLKRYAPTKEHVSLTDYYAARFDNECAVILNGKYLQDTPLPSAIMNDGKVYLELGFVKENIDSGYVYDPAEITLRYATDKEVYTATLGSADYSIDKSNNTLSSPVLVAQNDGFFISTEYMQLLTDFQITAFSEPDRVVIETKDYDKEVTTAKKDTEIRKSNGVKSPILEDVKKGEKLNVVRVSNDKDWSVVVSEKGVIGYMKNNGFSDVEKEAVKANLPDRVYNHISLGKEVNLLWHQLKNVGSNAEIANVIATSGNVNVMSPTWFYLNDNNGGIASFASTDYVNYCHSNNIQVWGLVSNLENTEVDSTAVLNTTSKRDALVNNLIAQAITYGLDGINVDFEQLKVEAADGYVQFIKELSIKCEKNDIILSVDDYVPANFNTFYNRKQQANYADYVIIMGYDEHYSGSEEPGSVASKGWVEQGVKDTLEEVPAEQVILGMPFYCRVWEIGEDGALSSKHYGLSAIQSYMKTNGVSATWDDALGQYYAEFTKVNTTYYIWVEDEKYLEEKLKIMDSYGLAGGAFWKKGFDNEGIWNVIAKYL